MADCDWTLFQINALLFPAGRCHELLQAPLPLDVLRDIPARLFILLHNLSQELLQELPYEFV